MQCAAGERPEQAAGTAHAHRPGRLPSPPKARLSLSPSFSRTRLRVHKQGDRDVGQEKGDGDQAHGPAGQGEGDHWRDVARSRLTKKRGDAGESKRGLPVWAGERSAGWPHASIFSRSWRLSPHPDSTHPAHHPTAWPSCPRTRTHPGGLFPSSPAFRTLAPPPLFPSRGPRLPPSRNRAPPSLSRRFHAPACSPWPFAPPPGPPAGPA